LAWRLLLVLGIGAVIFPMVSTLVATVFIGWILLISGIVALAGSFSFHGAGPFFGALLLGLLSIAAAAFLPMNPLAGAVALTLMLGMIFMIQGAFELFFAFEMRPVPGWSGMLASAIVRSDPRHMAGDFHDRTGTAAWGEFHQQRDRLHRHLAFDAALMRGGSRQSVIGGRAATKQSPAQDLALWLRCGKKPRLVWSSGCGSSRLVITRRDRGRGVSLFLP